MGDRYLRQLLIVGATSLVRCAREKRGTVDPRFVALLARKPARVASVAIANMMARIAWRSWRAAASSNAGMRRCWPRHRSRT